MNEASLGVEQRVLGWEGRVIAREASSTDVGQARISVAGPDGKVIALRALSCLVEPQPGDDVLVAASPGRHYVLAVLERGSTQPVELVVDQDLVITSKGGGVELRGRNVALEAGETELRTGRFRLTTASAEVFTHALSWLGGLAELDVKKVRTVAEVAESVVDRVSQTFGRVYRKVEDFEHVRAKRIDQRAELMNLRGKNAMLTAEQLVKLDADQVHLG
ncbi:MAG: DUF3540 domain-containing protein [Polyangiaceae bacterium]|nr:DUF3540 domain-containing protein [Myxococcales bacterium]MCB9586532.1 DUF3540 domain-containing protein [Polyangiaceae bacterium]MCB9606039.1 DUF3540 domain-containing protein [Polyangiaceae bacterium]